MRSFIRLTTVSAILAAMLISSFDADAQATRRANTTSSSQTRREATTTTKSNSSSSDTKRSAGTVTATRRSDNSSSNSRNDAATTTQSTQTRRNNNTATRTTGTSRSTNESNTTTPTTQDRRTTSNGNVRTDSKTGTNPDNNRGNASTATGTSNTRTSSRTGLTSSKEMQERSTAEPSRPAGTTATGNKAASQNRQELNYSGRERGTVRRDNNGNVNRVAPRDRDYVNNDKPGTFYGKDSHYFGYKIHTLPSNYKHTSSWGVDYYYYNNVYYRRYNDYYVVCRPPFGVVIAKDVANMLFARVRFAYYASVYHAYDVIDSNYRTILQQNRIIAQNNARIARQNSSLALNSSRALSSYEIANALGLVQSYAGINTDYYYEDGVFYTVNKKGNYEVIVPPAGALVDELPDDYDVIVLNGNEYYKVDDTVYRSVLIEGTPCLEVLGQMYGSMAKQYNYYYN